MRCCATERFLAQDHTILGCCGVGLPTKQIMSRTSDIQPEMLVSSKVYALSDVILLSGVNCIDGLMTKPQTLSATSVVAEQVRTRVGYW